jgi:hypothetical protein
MAVAAAERALKRLLRGMLPAPVFDRLKMMQRRLHFRRHDGFSEEEATIARYLDLLPVSHRYCVDIAAQDGIGGSQTLALFKRGWDGMAVEYDPAMFAVLSGFYRQFPGASLVRGKVTPDNVADMLRGCACPRDFGFLSLDIDSYDYFVLERILAEFRPTLMCVEVNEIVPPPLRFSVTYDPDHGWPGDHFQGQSIAQCAELCARHGYGILELHYNNLLLAPVEVAPGTVTPEQAYAEGYRDRPDRREKFPWNADVEPLLHLPPDEARAFLHRLFQRYTGKYVLT